MPKTESHDDDQDEDLEDQEVETSQEEDENLDADQDEDSEEDNDDEESEEESEDEDSDEEESDDEEPKFKKAYSQIKGDTPEEYAPNLEKAYAKSSREGKRLAQEKKDLQARLDAITAAVDSDPKLKAAIDKAAGGGVSPTVDPALLKAREDMEAQMDRDYAAFAEKHPELESDEDVQTQVFEEVALLGELYRKKGKILSMDKALRMAWSNLGLEEDDKKDRVRNKVKETASKPKANSSPKKKTKAVELTADQIKTGKRMGLTEKQMLEALGK